MPELKELSGYNTALPVTHFLELAFMLRHLRLVAILIALSLGWMGSASASQQAHEASILSNIAELQQSQATVTTVQSTADMQYSSLPQLTASELCQDSFHNHCIGCSATLDSPAAASIPPVSTYSLLPQLLSITLFANLIDYPPKPLS